jgi:hypothetical protein
MALTSVLSVFLRFFLASQNSRRDRFQEEEAKKERKDDDREKRGEEGAEAQRRRERHAFADLTDGENKYASPPYPLPP